MASTLHEKLHGKLSTNYQDSSRMRENWGDSENWEFENLENPRKVNWFYRGKIFFTTLTFLLGLSCYGIAYLVVFKNLQVNWRYDQSGYLTQINSVDVDKLTETIAREGLSDGIYCLDQSDGTIKKAGNCKTLSDLAREEKQARNRK